MKHKLMAGLLATLMTFTAAFGLTACGGGSGTQGGGTQGGGTQGGGEHTHTFSETWTSDENYHWHAATCTDTDEQKDRAAHDYENGVCGTCFYEHKNHTFVGTTCSVCGYTLSSSKLRYEEVLGEDGQTVTGYTVIGWDESVTDRTRLVIPAEYSGKPVVAVGESAFDVDDGDGDETLSYVYLPESVKDLGSYAFYGCSGLKSINLEHVENLYKGALYECTGLERAEMGELNTLGQYAFYGCTALTYVRVEGVETFEEQAFRNCPALERADFGDGVKELARYTFSESDGVRELTFGKSFSQIASGTTFPAALERIEVSAENATYATESGILYNKDKTEIVCAPKSIKGRVTIADGVTEIKNSESHFKNHNRLTSLTIPASVAAIEHDFIRKSFSGCDTLAEIYNLSQVTIDKLSDFGLGESTVIHASLSEKSVVTDPDKDGFVWRTDGDVLHTYLGREKELTLPDGHDGKPYAVAALAFTASEIVKVTVPSKVTAIGENCFRSSVALKEVVLQEGIAELGVGAFYNCTALAKISIPKSVKKVGAGAFTTIGESSALERVDYAGTVSEWAAINFGNEYSNIFVNELKEKRATLYLGDGKPLPEKIVIEGIEEVGTYAFYGAPVKEVVFGQGVKKIGQDAFAYCAELKSVVLGKEIENFFRAFPNGSPIETVYYEGSQETWAPLLSESGGSAAFPAGVQVYFFSQGTPTEEQWTAGDKWWHYGTDGSATPWTK